MKKNLAHDLNTLTRVYVEVSSMRDEAMSRHAFYTGHAFDQVLDMLNQLIDENWGELEQRYIFNDPSEIYREPDETSSVAFDGNDLPF